MRKWLQISAALVVAAFLVACNAATTTVEPTLAPTQGPSVPPTPAPTAGPSCPEPSDGMLLLRQDQLGFCVLYPEGLVPSGTPPCLVPEGPAMACHTAVMFFDATAAGGRTAEELVEEMAQGGGIGPERSSARIAGLEAIVLPLVGGQASSRDVHFVHDDRLFSLKFLLPDPGDASGVERFDRLYETVMGTFTLIPPSEAQTPSTAGPGPVSTSEGGGSAVIVFVESGNVLVWEESTGERRTIIDSGDAIRLELSDDGQLVAFVRRSFFEAGDFDRNEQSGLWVVGLDGSNPRELVSAAELRQQVGAAEAESTNFPRLSWIPNTHRLVYSGNTYDAHGYGEGAHTPLKGAYLVDADSLTKIVLAPPEDSLGFVPSPDGQQVALVTPTGLSFFSFDSHRLRRDVLTYPATGVPGKVTPMGVWTQDSAAFLVAAPIPAESQFTWSFTLWRVPVDGEPAEPLLTVNDSSPRVVFAPDGSAVAVVRVRVPAPEECVRGQQPARLARPIGLAGCPGQAETFLAALPEDLGPLAVPRDTLDYSRLVWSPGGLAYVSDLETRGDFYPLCPGAEQPIEVCGSPIHIPLQVEWLEWIDRSRFLYVTMLPRQLYLGSLGGSATLIAEDPASFDAVASTCVDDSEFVSDVTVPDGTHVAPEAVFQKTWRIRNSGTCTWDDSYRLAFLSGDRMSGPRSTPLGSLDISPEYRELFPTVRPGEEIEVSVTLIAPEAPGAYRGHWQLFAPDGTPFGTRPFVQIQVP